jgi:excisionase family DNA binding protein
MPAPARMKKAPIDYGTWCTKQQAAELIGVTTKSIERFVAAGTLEQASWQRPTGGPRLTVFHPDQVAQIAQRRRQAPIPHVMPAASQTNGNGNGHGLIVGRASPAAGDVRTVLQAIQRIAAAPPEPSTLFVTVAEAAAITGLSQAYVRRAIEAGTLPAIRDRGWRIYRQDLKVLRPNPQQR